MNTFQIILKNMRQRALSTSLTTLSVMLGVSLAIGILILKRESMTLFAQSDFGYEILLGPPKGDPQSLVLNSVYHLGISTGLIPYSVYEDVSRRMPPPAGRADYRQFVKMAIPIMVGDSYRGRRIIGTAPQMFGANDDGTPVQGDRFEYRKGRSFEVSDGRPFRARRFEAVVGADAAKTLKLHRYDDSKSEEENLAGGGAIRATHGMPADGIKADIHAQAFHIVGILKPTGTANDRAVFVPFISLLAIADHEAGLIEQALLRARIDPSRVPPERLREVLQQLGINPEALPEQLKQKYRLTLPATRAAAPATTQPIGDLMSSIALPADTFSDDHEHPTDPGHVEHEEEAFTLDVNGDIVPNVPQDEWKVSAIFIKARGGPGFSTTQLLYNFRVIDDRAIAAEPAAVMREFFDTFLTPTTTLFLVVSVLVTIVAGASIATTIYNSVAARLREIAILRALGATRDRILVIICSEALLIGVVGGVLGLFVGHALALIASIAYLQQKIGEGINWYTVDRSEIFYLLAVAALAFIAGLIPAMKAYRTPVATNLVAS